MLAVLSKHGGAGYKKKAGWGAEGEVWAGGGVSQGRGGSSAGVVAHGAEDHEAEDVGGPGGVALITQRARVDCDAVPPAAEAGGASPAARHAHIRGADADVLQRGWATAGGITTSHGTFGEVRNGNAKWPHSTPVHGCVCWAAGHSHDRARPIPWCGARAM